MSFEEARHPAAPLLFWQDHQAAEAQSLKI